jgi:hypothetical protein
LVPEHKQRRPNDREIQENIGKHIDLIKHRDLNGFVVDG